MLRATSSSLADQDQPRIPPFSFLGGIGASSEVASLRLEVEYNASQKDTAAFELETDGFTYRPFRNNPDISFDICTRNLNDDVGRAATSFRRDTAPLQGRDVSFGLRYAF